MYVIWLMPDSGSTAAYGEHWKKQLSHESPGACMHTLLYKHDNQNVSTININGYFTPTLSIPRNCHVYMVTYEYHNITVLISHGI